MAFGAGSAASSSFFGLPGSADQLLDGMVAAAGPHGLPGVGGLGGGAAGTMNPMGVGGFGFVQTGGMLPTLPAAPAWPSSLALSVATAPGTMDGTVGAGRSNFSFAAPGGPGAPQVSLASRGGGGTPQQTTAVPASVGAAFANIDVDGLSEFLSLLGVKDKTSMRAFCCVAEADMETALASTSIEGFSLTPIQRGEIVAAVREAFAAQGMA